MTLSLSLAQINNSRVVLKTAFQHQLSTLDTSMIAKLAMTNPSSNASETYTGLNAVPSISEFKDERKIKQLLGKKFSIENKKWEATISVAREDIERDSLGLYVSRVREMAKNAGLHPYKLIMDKLMNGHTGTDAVCYDGQYFFDTDHSEGASGTQSNKLSGNGVTVANVETDIAAAIAAMRNFKDDAGEPFFGDTEIFGNVLFIVPPALQFVFNKVVKSATVENGGANAYAGAGEVYVSNRLTDANDWYMIYTGGNMKPFIYQTEVPVEFAALDTLKDEESFMRDQYLYGTYARYNVGYGLWQYAIKTTNT